MTPMRSPLLMDFPQSLAAQLPISQLSLSDTAWVLAEMGLGFGLFWLGQFVYQRVFRKIALNEQLFVRDNVAVAIALVGFYLGITFALASVFSYRLSSWAELIQGLVLFGLLAIALMILGAWVGDHLILRRFDCAREVQQEANQGAALVEGGLHLANGLILSTAMAGEGPLFVGLGCWGVGLLVLLGVCRLYVRMARYPVFSEIRDRNNIAAGLALAGVLVGTGIVVRSAFTSEFSGWSTVVEYGVWLGLGLLGLVGVRWLADWVLVPGVKFDQEIAQQAVPNVGAGLIEAFAYVAGALLITWTL